MSEPWHYQMRVYLADALAEVARRDPADPALGLLAGVLKKHGATIRCQLDAFAAYVAEAEAHGVDGYALYNWTKATIDDPEKRAKHGRAFAIHVKGREVYSDAEANALAADLEPLVDGTLITRLSRHDTNPANNLPIPDRFRSPRG